MSVSQSNILPAGKRVSSSPRCMTGCRQRRPAKAREALWVWPPSLDSPLPHLSWQTPGNQPQLFGHWCFAPPPTTCGPVFSPDFCDSHRSPSWGFLPYLLVSISVSLLSLLALTMWHQFQNTNSETSIILVFESAGFTFCFKRSLCQVLGPETCVNAGSSAALPRCPALPPPPRGHGAAIWSPLIIFHAHGYT